MPRGESSRENSPLTLRISEDSMFGDRITTLSSRSYREPAGGPAFSWNCRSAGCKSFLLAGRLQLPEVSLVSDSLTDFDSTLFSERLLFR